MGKNSLIKSTTPSKSKADKKVAPEEESQEKAAASPTPEPEEQKGVKTSDQKETSPKAPKKETPPAPKNTAPDKNAPPPKEKPPQPPEPPVTVTYDTPAGPSSGDPIDKTLMILAGCVLFLFVLIIGASASNSSKYYVKELPVGIEIQKGRFAPLGEETLITLPDIKVPEDEKDIYNQNDVYPLIFKHYLNKADELLEAPGLPDYENIRANLTRAQNYAVNSDLAEAASKRLTIIELSNLRYRANVAQDQDTADGLETALNHLLNAARLDIDDDQLEQITKQRDAIKDRLRELNEIEAALEAMPKEPEAVEITD